MNNKSISKNRIVRNSALSGLLVFAAIFCAPCAIANTVRAFHCDGGTAHWDRGRISRTFGDHKCEPHTCAFSNLSGGKCGIVVFNKASNILVGVENDAPPIGFIFIKPGNAIPKLKVRVVLQPKEAAAKPITLNLTGADLRMENHKSAPIGMSHAYAGTDVYWLDSKKLQVNGELKPISRVYVYLDEQNPGFMEYHAAILFHKAHNSPMAQVGKRDRYEFPAPDLKSGDCSVLDGPPAP